MPTDVVSRYVIALVFLAIALGVRVGMNPWLGDILSHPTIFTAILLATWYCGAGPAALIAVLGYPAVEYLIRESPFSGWQPSYVVSSLGLYATLSAVIIFCVNSFRRERDKLMAAEAKLVESEQRMRASFENAALGIVELDAEDRFIEVNQPMCRILGYTRDEMIGRKVKDITAPEDRRLTEEVNARLRAGKVDHVEYEKRYVRKDGSPVWAHVTVSLIRDDSGRHLRSIATIEDVSERKEAEEKVSLLSHAIESAANSIVLTDSKGRILWVNRAFTELTGYSREELIDNSPKILKSGQQPLEFYKNLWDTILRGDSWRGELVNRRKDGSLYNEEMTITPVRARGEEITHFVGVKENITARKQAEEALHAATISAERAKATAEKANEAKDHFLAVLSHELRTPLTPVLAAVQLLQRRPNVTEEMRQPMEIIRRNVQLEARLIDDLLDLTRIVQGKLALDRKPMRLCTAIERAVEICKPDIDARKLHFTLELEDAPYVIDGDVARLQQVVWNLLNNAVKFTPEGGHIAVRCRQESRQVIVEVADTGIGIEPPMVARIFDAFEQGEPGIARQFGGLGLGLAIAKRLVEMHEGTISAHSGGRDAGATFRIALPLSGAQPGTETRAPATQAAQRSRRILLVEDHGDTATSMKMLLEISGYEVDTAGDVAQALKAVDGGRYDMLISDLGLPDRSGLELMQMLRQRGNGLKGIALSGYGRDEDMRRSRQAGFSEHLTKPVDVDTLLGAVARLL